MVEVVGGMTRQHQALDISVSEPFSDYWRKECETWWLTEMFHTHTPSGRSRGGLLQNFQNGSPTFEKRSYERWRAVVKTFYVSNALDGAVLIFSAPRNTFVIPGNQIACTIDQDIKQINLFLNTIFVLICVWQHNEVLLLDIDNLNYNTGGGEIFRTRPDRPWGPPSLLYNKYWVFPGGKAAGAWPWLPNPSSAEVQDRVKLYLYPPPVGLRGLCFVELRIFLYVFFSEDLFPNLGWVLQSVSSYSRG